MLKTATPHRQNERGDEALSRKRECYFGGFTPEWAGFTPSQGCVTRPSPPTPPGESLLVYAGKTMGRLRRSLLGISVQETTFARRGFRGGDAGARERLEAIGRVFLRGYHAALEDDRLEPLALRLNGVEAEMRGFAFEGAAMGLALLDTLTPWRRSRFARFLAGPGAPHVYMAHVGAG